jgi:hypothetical protein
MVNFVIFYDHLEYFTAIAYILQPFGLVCGPFGIFSQFGMFGPRKIWQPCLRQFLRAIFRGEWYEKFPPDGARDTLHPDVPHLLHPV